MKKESEKILNYAKKIKSINYLGGKCIKCKEDNILVLTFHHINPTEKEFSYNDYKSYRWSILKNELDKCEILCHNCHREFHHNKNNLKYGDSRRRNKNIYLEYSGSFCKECGYDKCPASLTFHHRDSNIKDFSIGSIGNKFDSIYNLSEKIKNELDKCDVLCANCHVLKHTDVEFFESNKDDIYKKEKTYKEIIRKINREDIYEMYKKGMKQIDISRYYGSSKSTISKIIKKYSRSSMDLE